MNAITKTEQPENLLPADPMISMIERIALDPNSDLEKLERMLEMKERLEAKQARSAFDMAMAEAKKEIRPIAKTGTVDYTNTKGDRTNFKHETLDGIAEVVDPILSQNGLSYRFRSAQDGGQLIVTCIIAHRDGYSEETSLQGAPDSGAGKNNYQALGSAATYLQRYTLKLALGLSAAKDDDSHAATVGVSAEVSAEQYIKLRDAIEDAGVDEQTFLTAYKATSLQTFPANRLENALKRIADKKAQAAK